MVEGNHSGEFDFISVKVIPHDRMRYETCGDYIFDEGGSIHIKVSAMGNRDYEFLVAIHELAEAYLCQKQGISEEEITAFDIEFEESRMKGDESEPGDDRRAPYQIQHGFATSIERMMAAALGVSWQDYESAVLRLSK